MNGVKVSGILFDWETYKEKHDRITGVVLALLLLAWVAVW